jgi:hypothetical protein
MTNPAQSQVGDMVEFALANGATLRGYVSKVGDSRTYVRVMVEDESHLVQLANCRVIFRPAVVTARECEHWEEPEPWGEQHCGI